jgi:hypothetical protein
MSKALDKRIGTEVMGWPIKKSLVGDYSYYNPTPTLVGSGIYVDSFRPSQYMEDALRVKRHLMAEYGCTFLLEEGPKHKPSVVFSDGDCCAQAFGNTTQRAIANAAIGFIECKKIAAAESKRARKRAQRKGKKG